MPGEGTFSGVVGQTDVWIETGRGTLHAHVPHTPGSPQAPMTSADRTEKFLDGAGRCLPGRDAEALLAALRDIRACADVRKVTRRLEVAAPARAAA